MQDIKSFDAASYATLIAEISQTQNQYDNLNITLHRINDDNADYANDPQLPAGAIVMIEDYCTDSNYFLLDPGDAADAIADPVKFLREMASDWACNDDTQLECYRWGIRDPSEDIIDDGYAGECRIVREGCWYGFAPYDYVTPDNSDTPIIFSDPSAAQAWIDEAEDGAYYLSHNEADRPSYYIVAA